MRLCLKCVYDKNIVMFFLLILVCYHVQLSHSDTTVDLAVSDVTKLHSNDHDLKASAASFLVGISKEQVRHRALLSIDGVSRLREKFSRSAATSDRCLRIVSASLRLHVISKTVPTFEQRDAMLVRTSARTTQEKFLFRLFASEVKRKWQDRIDGDAAGGDEHLWSAPPLLDANGRDAKSSVTFANLSSDPDDVTLNVDVKHTVWRWLIGAERNNGLLVWMWQDLLLGKVQWDGLKSGALLEMASLQHERPIWRPSLQVVLEGAYIDDALSLSLDSK